MRWFALYLPQFHETEENNKWWGEGFTEWTHVNAAKPLYRKHKQPIVPMDRNYYNLMDKNTVEWQTALAKKYGIDGFVYYHYYFCGKKLLEKPAENLLKWKDIDQPFFFCWANHTWYKAVDGIKNVLIEQTYGSEKEWEDHFQYLLPFFNDERYEKKDNKPVFMIFDHNFSEKKAMVDYFDNRCKQEGFNGIYIIETLINALKSKNIETFFQNTSAQTEQIYVREPSISISMEERTRMRSPMRIVRKILRTLSFKGIISWVNKYSGNHLYNIMLKKSLYGKNICHGLFFSWDNTPRHGVRGYIITPPSKEKFMKYAENIQKDEYVFINAWNEWAEGMILEPTEHLKYKYLEWIKEFRENIKNEETL